MIYLVTMTCQIVNSFKLRDRKGKRCEPVKYEKITAKVSFSPMKINGYLTIDDIKSLHKSVKIITDLKLFRRFF